MEMFYYSLFEVTIVIKNASFSISFRNFCWTNDTADNPQDLCLHGDVTVTIEDNNLSYSCCCISASALQMLRSLTEDHEITPGEQMLPCCGFTMLESSTPNRVDIIGCDNGIDYSVSHKEDSVIIKTQEGMSYQIPLHTYRNEVLSFAKAVESFYHKCSPKILPTDSYDRNGYLAFWKEWSFRIKN